MVNKERRRSGLSADLACDGRLRFIAAQHTYDAKRLEAVRGGKAYRALGESHLVKNCGKLSHYAFLYPPREDKLNRLILQFQLQDPDATSTVGRTSSPAASTASATRRACGKS